MSMPFTTRVQTNLNGALQMTQLVNGIMMTGDNAANQIIVELYNDFDKVLIPSDTKIMGYFIRADGETLEIDGEVTSDGEAKVVIPEAAYQITGTLSIAIRMLSEPTTVTDEETNVEYVTWGSKIVIATLSCFVQLTESNSIIDVYHHIPDVQELLAYIEVLDNRRNAIDAEEEARVTAESTRATNETNRQNAETARATAESTRATNETKRKNAETARATAESTRATNETNRKNAETARATAESTRATNETNRQNAEIARETNTANAISSIENIEFRSSKLSYSADPTVTASEDAGDGHKIITLGLPVGAPFKIKKTFSSVSQMNSYSGNDISTGDFVIIVSDTEDEDNAKLYVKTESSYQFIVDLSGSQGFKGETGNGIASATVSSYKLKLTFTDGTSYTSGSLRGATGATGATGNGISSVVLNADNTLTFTYTDGTSYTSGSVKGDAGKGISSVVLNADNTLTFTYTDGTSYTSGSVKGAKGATGATGKGISSVVLNADNTLTFTYTDGTSYTSGSVKGDPGENGIGNIAASYEASTDTINLTIT